MGRVPGGRTRGGRDPRPGGPPPAAAPTVSHPVFATLYDCCTGSAEHLLGPRRRALLAGCHGEVLDLGAGTGANFPFFCSLIEGGISVRLHAVEPDPHMERRARRRAQALGLPVDLRSAPAEQLPFEDGSFDYIISTLVLCTVADPRRAVSEAYRVLRPEGELRFLEHVRTTGAAGHWQDRLRPLWALLAGGCQLNRPTGETLRAAPFRHLEWEETWLPFPLCRLLTGRARKGMSPPAAMASEVPPAGG